VRTEILAVPAMGIVTTPVNLVGRVPSAYVVPGLHAAARVAAPVMTASESAYLAVVVLTPLLLLPAVYVRAVWATGFHTTAVQASAACRRGCGAFT